ncbi:MAG: hypothetical protein K6E75_00500 [Lachnospiraceae bacterium]|nr:hypothetical protein [Lachnospiraceae bacterium]
MKEYDIEEVLRYKNQEEVKAELFSEDFDNREPEEKKTIVRAYFEKHIEDKAFKGKKQSDVDFQKNALNAHFEKKEYIEFENKLIRVPGKELASFKDFEKMDQLADYMGSDAIHMPRVKYKPHIFKSYLEQLDPLTSKALPDPNVQKAEELQQNFLQPPVVPDPVERKSQAQFEFNNDISELDKTVVYKRKKSDTKIDKPGQVIDKYGDALKVFNTKRAAIFEQESEEHKKLREAAEEIVKFRRDAHDEKMGPAERLSNTTSQDKKMDIAKEWLEKVSVLCRAADEYLEKKDGLTITFAGNDRKKGARELQKLAKKEMKLCLESIEKEGLSLAEIYKDIAYDKVKKAEETAEELYKVADRTNADSMRLYEAVHDALAAYASNHLIMKLEKEKGKENLTQQDVKNIGFFDCRAHNTLMVSNNMAVLGYVEHTSAGTIKKDLGEPNQLINALKKYKKDIQKDILKDPKKPEQKKTELTAKKL